MKKYLWSGLLFMAAARVLAGSSEGLVTMPLSHNSGNGYFMFSAGPHINKPACSTAGDAWAVDVSTAAGRGIQSTILAAFSMGKTLHVEGRNVCDAWGDRETPSYVYIVN